MTDILLVLIAIIACASAIVAITTKNKPVIRWNTIMMKPCDTPVECGEDCPGEPTCGFVHRQENSWERTWQCNCNETPCLRRLPEEERPNRRAAIEATKRKQEARRALVG